MAGHSKFKNIQHRKGAQDKKRAKVFNKIAKEIEVAAKMGAPDPDMNPRLRLAISNARSANMPKDRIERAIKSASETAGGDNYEEIRYEGYGPNGIAIMVDCMTDNRNRTVAEVRHVFSKRGGNMGTDGCVAFMFNQKGIISLVPGVDEDSVMEVALEAGAEDIVTNDDGSIDVFTTPDDYAVVKDALDGAGFEAQSAEVTMHPDNTVSLDLDDAQKAIAMIDAFEELDDVQQVYSNADFSDEVMAQLEN